MDKRKIYLLSGFIIVSIAIGLFTLTDNKKNLFTERVKVSLRSIGNQLLLSQQDSISLILPVIVLEENRYQLSFQEPISFEPELLVSIIDSSFLKAKLPNNYVVETVQCEAKEVAYSYQILNTIENSIVPCKGRILPENCYTIEVLFTDLKAASFNNEVGFYMLFFSGFVFLFLGFYKKKPEVNNVDVDKKIKLEDYATLGSFQFYPEQNKLIKQAEEISLSKKECELLEIFVANPNQIIKRDELTKRVWEDHGVFVGRSLDTYISKLRKKLKSDESIKITNIHGVGYKLEFKS